MREKTGLLDKKCLGVTGTFLVTHSTHTSKHTFIERISNMEHVICGEGKYTLDLYIQTTSGNGIAIIIQGGTSPHVGGFAAAVPRPRSDGKGMTCDISTYCYPGHKDVYMASNIAGIAALATNESISVTAGVHIDGATKEELQLLQKTAEDGLHSWLDSYLQ